MDILAVLKNEEAKLEMQLKAIQEVIAALNGSHSDSTGHESVHTRRTMSAAGRAAISRATKARWARFRVNNKAKKAK